MFYKFFIVLLKICSTSRLAVYSIIKYLNKLTHCWSLNQKLKSVQVKVGTFAHFLKNKKM